MSKRHKRSRLAGAVLAGVLVFAAACGDDSDGDAASVDAVDDATFCARFEQLQDKHAGDGDDDLSSEALARLTELAAAAPDPEVRDALVRLGAIAEELDRLNDDDPEAMALVFGLMGDPTFTRSMEALDTYVVEQCGLDDSGFGSAGFDAGGFGTDGDIGIDFDEDAYQRLNDDLDLLRGPLEAELGSLLGVGTMGFGSAPTLSIDLDTSVIDPVEACEVAGSVFDRLLSADGLPVEVNDLEFEVVASRPAGGACAPA